MAPRGITRGEVVVLLDDLREEVLALYRDHGLELDSFYRPILPADR